MSNCSLRLFFALLAPTLAWAAPNPRLVLPEFPALAQKATESELNAREEDAVLTIRSLAAGELSETELASWIENNCAPI